MLTFKSTTDSALVAKMNEEVQNLHHEIAPDIFKPFDENLIEGFFKRMLVKEHSNVVVAYHFDIPIGYIFFEIVNQKDNAFFLARKLVNLDHIVVLSEFQKLGYGNQLMTKLIEIAREEKAESITLSQWTQNIKAGKFFESFGFVNLRNNLSLDLKIT